MTKQRKQLKQINWAHWIAGQVGVVPLSLEMPGVAKTATHVALAEQVGRPFYAYLLDQIVPEDLGGYPVVREAVYDGGHRQDVMRRVHDEVFVNATRTPSIILFDELTNVGHTVQAAALKIINEGIPGTWIFAAANPVDKAAAGVELAPPMVNRLCVLDWEIDRDAILDGWRNGLEFPTPNLPVLPADWLEFADKWGGLMARFIELFPNLLASYPKDADKASSPYPTPRSWTNVVRCLAGAESVRANAETKSKLVYGCVGAGAGSQFLQWVSAQDLPDPEALLADPKSLSLPKRGDLSMQILASVWEAVRLDRTVERWEAAREILELAHSQSAEVATAAEGKLWKLKPDGYEPKSISRKGKLAKV